MTLDRGFCRDTIFMSSRWLSVPAVVLAGCVHPSLPVGLSLMKCGRVEVHTEHRVEGSALLKQDIISLPSQPRRVTRSPHPPLPRISSSPSPATSALSSIPKQSTPTHSKGAERKQALESGRPELQNQPLPFPLSTSGKPQIPRVSNKDHTDG